MNTLKQKCALEELTKHIDKIYIHNYEVTNLTKNSTIEAFEYKSKQLILLRVNSTAILLAKINGISGVEIQRVCEAHNLDKFKAKAIQKFCYKFSYKTTNKNGLKVAPKWCYIKEHLLNYVRANPLEWAVDEM